MPFCWFCHEVAHMHFFAFAWFLCCFVDPKYNELIVNKQWCQIRFCISCRNLESVPKPPFKIQDKCVYTWKKMPTVKHQKSSDTWKLAVIMILTMWFYHCVMHPKEAVRIANSVDPDQISPSGADWFSVYTAHRDANSGQTFVRQ